MSERQLRDEVLRAILKAAGVEVQGDSPFLFPFASDKQTFTVVVCGFGQWLDQFPNHPGSQESMLETAGKILEGYYDRLQRDWPGIMVIDTEDILNAEGTAITVWPPFAPYGDHLMS
ncbi:hypothetical protein KGQ24_02135 [Patescibacteria group bacterium]|nr:hypothetical protein [Patescibacteria group bacterium]